MARTKIKATIPHPQMLAFMEQQRRIAELKEAPRVEVVLTAAGEASVADNIIKARANKKQGRNPFYVTDEEREKIHNLAKMTTSGFIRPENARTLYSLIGHRIKGQYIAHMDEGKGPGGRPFAAPTTRGYVARKKRQFGTDAPLKKRGDLRAGLNIRVKGVS